MRKIQDRIWAALLSAALLAGTFFTPLQAQTAGETSKDDPNISTEASNTDTSVLDYSTGNGILRKTYEELLEKAKKDLEEQAGEKEMYALVYLTDSYGVKKEAAASSDTIASLESGHTVQIMGMEVDWNTAKIQSFAVKQEEQTTQETSAEETTSEDITQESTVQESTTEEDTTQESAVQEPTTEEDTTQESTVQESAAEEKSSADESDQTAAFTKAIAVDEASDSVHADTLDNGGVSENDTDENNTSVSENTIQTAPAEETEEQEAKLEAADYITQLPTVYYKVFFYVGETSYTGYIEEKNLAYSDEVLLKWKDTYIELFELPQAGMYSIQSQSVSYADVEQFPTSYQVYLSKLKAAHPNWTFVPMNTGKDWNSCVTEQYGSDSEGEKYSLIYYTAPESYRAEQIDSTWYHASKTGISYYMDPRNFLNENYIFQFEQNTFNASYHTVSALQSFLSNTFMSGVIPDDSSKRTYANAIWSIGKTRKLSPFNLAARIIQEQGINGSKMVSGTYEGYEGYYNFFNVKAEGSGAHALQTGLAYAKKMDWNTRYKSIEGGAATIGNGYILKGQDTLYLQKFDVEKKSGALHQYMQNIQAPSSEGYSMKKMYTNAGSLNSAFVFKIPVFNNMSGINYTISPTSAKLKKTETKTLTVKGNNVTIDNSKVTFSTADKSIATVSADGVITAVDNGTTTISAAIKADGKTVTLKCTVTVYTPLESISLNQEAVKLYRPDTADAEHSSTTKLVVSYYPADTTDSRTVTYTSSNKNVAAVTRNDDDTAIVTAVGEGTAKITAKVGTQTAVCTVTVLAPMQEAYLNKNALELYDGKQGKLTVTFSPTNTTDSTEVIWISDDEAIASVKDGTVTANAPGETVIRASVPGSSIKKFDGATDPLLQCKVTVTDCVVTFRDENGEIYTQDELPYGKKLGDIVYQAEKNPWQFSDFDNRIFCGWYTGENGTGTKVTEDTTVYSHMTLYPYYEENDKGFFVKPLGDMTYTGSTIKPVVEVYDKNTLLILGKDYTVSYKNNKNVKDTSDSARAPQVIIKGKGNYSGSETVLFNIIPKDISDSDIEVPDILKAYNGKIQKAAPTVKRNGKTLKKGTDYSVDYLIEGEGAYQRPGSYAVEIKGINGYTGTQTIHIQITGRTLITKTSVTTIRNQSYTGTALEPPITLKYSGKTLEEEKDYTVSYSDNQNIGTATVTITGIGEYIGTRTRTFKIVGTAISKAKISGIVSKEYTGDEISQDYTITDKEGNPLVKDVDYQLTNPQNTAAGTAVMLFTGINKYSGTVKKTFKITPYNIAVNDQTYNNGQMEEAPAFEIDQSEINVKYEKGGSKPEPKVYFKGQLLTLGKDYTLSYKNNNAVNDGTNEKKIPTITVRGKGNFKGSVTKPFTITKGDISTVSITAADAVYKNRNNFWMIKPVLTDANGKRLTAGSDYDRNFEYTYASYVTLSDGTQKSAGDPVEPGDIPTPGENNDAKIKVTVTGLRNYDGECSAVFRIIPQSISSASVKIAKQTYLGEGVEVRLDYSDITIKIGKQELSAEDYEIVSYTNNTKKGTAKVTLRGTGSYGGVKTVNFTIAAKGIFWWENADSYEITKAASAYDNNVIRTNTKDFSNISIACIGDSIAECSYLSSDLQTSQSMSFPAVIENVLQNEKVYNLGLGGAGFMSSNFTFLERNEGEADRLSAIPADVDFIVVQLGINDCTGGNRSNFGTLSDEDLSTYCGGINCLIKRLKQDYRQAKIVFCTPFDCKITGQNKDYELQDYADAMSAICRREEIKVIDFCGMDIMNGNDARIAKEYMRDEVHPNPEGQKLLGKHIASALIEMM